jgi:hypothetical protein
MDVVGNGNEPFLALTSSVVRHKHEENAYTLTRERDGASSLPVTPTSHTLEQHTLRNSTLEKEEEGNVHSPDSEKRG